MTVIIDTKINNGNNVNDLIDKMYQTCLKDPNLSPRPKRELLAAYDNSNILIAIDGRLIIGWLLKIPYNRKLQELAAGYVVESHRSKRVFNKLLQAALNYAPISCIVTFNYPFADYLLNKIGFKKSSLWEAIKLSKGRFIINRINIDRLKAIKKHYRSNKPIYTIYRTK